jgi:ArsR family transcriptional regulator, arsenate/arsenite/antimonite-responsive transcriptional repressor
MARAVAAHPVDLMFKAFSDRTRLRILHLLQPGELCVCDIVSILALPQAKVSRHLAYLRRAKLVEVRKDGLWSHYRLAPAGGTFHQKLLDCLACCFREVPQLVEDHEKLPIRSPACCAVPIDMPGACSATEDTEDTENTKRRVES